MTRTKAYRLRKGVGAVLLCMAMFSVSGCVYLRFLALKNQLGDFSQNVRLSYDQATTFHFKNPVLFDKDMTWLMRSEPSRRSLEESTERWLYWLEKQYDGGERDDIDFDMKIGMVFKKNLLVELWFPARFQEIMDEEVMVGMFEDVKHSAEDEKSISSEWSWFTGPPNFGKLDVFLRVLGKPYERIETEEAITMLYAFNIKNGSADRKKGKYDHSLKFVFGKKDSIMRNAKVNLGRLSLRIDTEKGVKIKL